MGIYVGVGGVAHKVKKAYIGVSGAARKIKKGYVGVGGAARLMFSGAPEKVASVTPLSLEKIGLKVAYTGNYVVMANGNNVSGYHHRPVEVYDTSLTKIAATDLGSDREGMAPANIGGYACFVGGIWRDTNTNFGSMIRYDASLVRSSASVGLALSSANLAVARNTNYTFFLGGTQYNDTYRRTVTAMSDAFAATSLSNLFNDMTAGTVSALSTAAYAVFATAAIAYDNARVQVAFSGITTSGSSATGALLKNYILFAGGSPTGGGVTNEIAVYDLNLTRVGTATLANAAQRTMAVSRDDYCIIAGGYVTTFATAFSTVAGIDTFLVRDDLQNLSTGRFSAACFNIGDYAGFAGGYATIAGGGYGVVNVVEAYRF
jgi:hypothetical protein